jgi:uncharacterized protein (TIGR03435 family)
MTRTSHRGLALLAAVFLAGVAPLAQDRPSSPEPAFEVASVKANLNDAVPEAIALQANGIRYTAFRVRTLIAMAYRSAGIQRFDQILAGPSWIAVDRFDVVATLGGDSAEQAAMSDRLPAMLRTLLRERFGLRIHIERRRMPAYALVIARRDRRLGPQLRESKIECPTALERAAANADPDRWCGIRAAGGLITGRAVSAAELAGNLGGYPSVDRFVTDRTGLSGRYDFRLEYSPGVADVGDPISNAGPSLFTALTEQLGLKLQTEPVSLPVLVIENIERPTPD